MALTHISNWLDPLPVPIDAADFETLQSGCGRVFGLVKIDPVEVAVLLKNVSRLNLHQVHAGLLRLAATEWGLEALGAPSACNDCGYTANSNSKRAQWFEVGEVHLLALLSSGASRRTRTLNQVPRTHLLYPLSYRRIGTDGTNRTCDARRMKPLPYQLSYASIGFTGWTRTNDASLIRDSALPLSYREAIHSSHLALALALGCPFVLLNPANELAGR